VVIGDADYVIADIIFYAPVDIMAELPWCGHKKVTLQEQRDFLSNVVNNIGALVVILDKDGRIIRYNKACERLFGYTATEIELPLSSGLLPPPREIELIKALNDKLQAGQDVDQYEGRWMTKNGDLRTIVWSTTLLRDPDGAMEYILATGTDITERKRAEEESKEREQEFRMIADNIPGLVSYIDQDGCYRFANNGYKEWFGVALGEIIGKHYRQVLGESVYDLIKNYVDAALSGQQVSYEEELPYRLGGTRWVFANYIPDVDERGKVKGFFALVTDITERKRMEEALRVSAQYFRALIVHSSDVIALLSSDGTILYVSSSASQLLGFDEERIGQNAFARVHPDDEQYVRSQFAQLLEQPGASVNVQVRVQYGDGTWHWTEATGTNLLAEPSVKAIVINSRDITERKLAEEALVKEQYLLSALMDNLPDHIFFKDTESCFTRINKAKAEWLGLSDPAQALGKTDFDFFSEDHARPAYEDEQRIIRTGQALVNIEEREMWSDRPDTWVSTTKLPLRDKEGRIIGTFGVSRDITERKRAEETLHHRFAELEALHTVSAALRAAQTRDETLPILLDETLATLETEAGVIWLYHPEHDELHAAVARGWFQQLSETPLKPGEGIAGTVFASGQAHVSVEFRNDPAAHATTRAQIPAGWGGACVPIRSGAITVGVLFVSVPLPRQISPEQVKLLESLAEMAGASLHRMSLYEATVRQLDQLQSLHDIDLAITASMELRMTLNVMLSHVLTQLKVDAANVLLLNPHLQTLEYAAGRGFRTDALKNTRLRLGEGYAGRAALERKLVHIPDLRGRKTDFLRSPFFSTEGFVAYYGMPLIAKGQVKGVLEIFHRAPLAAGQDWVNLIETLTGQVAFANDYAQLFDNLQRSNMDLVLAYDATIKGWSRALDLRDEETEGHTQRVTELTERLARAMNISEAEIVHIRRGALLHDIGKMGVPDGILLKPDKLTDDEWVLMRKHPQLAFDLLAPITYLKPALDIPYCHHEKWDGSGYPRGLKGVQIPLAARLFAVVDVWDALHSDRPYRSAWPEEKALEYIHAESGKHFDPQVVKVFERIIGEG